MGYNNNSLVGNESGLGFWNFSSGSGDILYDYSGNQNHGTIVGATGKKLFQAAQIRTQKTIMLMLIWMMEVVHIQIMVIIH